MFLGVDQLLKLVKEKKLVEGLCQRELERPEGCGFDLRLGEVYKIRGEGYLGVEERKTCEIESIGRTHWSAPTDRMTPVGVDRRVDPKSSIILNPGDFYLVKTIEKVNMPSDLVGIFKPRSTLQRMGIFLRTAQVSPGYCGELTFGMANLGPCKVRLDLGARIVHIMFARVEGKTTLYCGQWQGGRVTTRKKEKQI